MGDSFTHLHVHTEYSMLDGAARVGDVVAAAAADGQPAIGITDHGNMYGILPFYKACKEQGIKPILGTEAYQADDSRFERPSRRGRVDDTGGDAEGGKKLYYHLTLLAENNAGYKNLIQLASRAFMEGYYYKPRVDWELLEQHSEGVIATTGCLGGHVLQHLLRGDDEGALKAAGRLQDIFGKDNLFVEIQDHDLPEQHRTNPLLFDIAKRIGAPLLATNDSHYTHREDAVAHDALLCVQTGSQMSDPDRFKFTGDSHYLKSAAEMRRLFSEVEVACDNSLWIAERCDVEITFGNPLLPEFPLPEGFDDDAAYLRHLTFEGAKKRWGDPCPTPWSNGWPTSSRSSATWASAPTSSSPGTSSAMPATPTSASAPAEGQRPGARWPTRSGSPTSTPSATTCCSSASSTPAGSPCPTSTWTSTPATATR